MTVDDVMDRFRTAKRKALGMADTPFEYEVETSRWSQLSQAGRLDGLMQWLFDHRMDPRKMTDEQLRQIPGIGPIRLVQLRERIEQNHPSLAKFDEYLNVQQAYAMAFGLRAEYV